MAVDLGSYILCLEPTGIAANNLSKGKTIHGEFNFTFAVKTGAFLSDLTTDKLRLLNYQMNTDNLTLVIMEEISYAMLAHIYNCVPRNNSVVFH